MGDAVDLIIAYKFIRVLSTPWVKWDAYELSIIDKTGKKLKKPITAEEKKALPGWMNLIRNIKRFIEKIPFGKTRLGSFASALWLIKEEMGLRDISWLEEELLGYLTDADVFLTEASPQMINTIEPGKYQYKKQILYTQTPLKPVGRVYNENIFVVSNITKTKEYVVTWAELIPI